MGSYDICELELRWARSRYEQSDGVVVVVVSEHLVGFTTLSKAI